MPTPRPAQAAACFLVELRNRDKFLFDIGDGGTERLFALQIPMAFFDKVFIGRLHGDHFGGIGSLFVGGGNTRRVRRDCDSPAPPVSVTGLRPRV